MWGMFHMMMLDGDTAYDDAFRAEARAGGVVAGAGWSDHLSQYLGCGCMLYGLRTAVRAYSAYAYAYASYRRTLGRTIICTEYCRCHVEANEGEC